MSDRCLIVVRYMFDICSTHVRHVFDTCSMHVRWVFNNMLDKCSVDVRYKFDTNSVDMVLEMSPGRRSNGAEICGHAPTGSAVLLVAIVAIFFEAYLLAHLFVHFNKQDDMDLYRLSVPR